MKAKKRILDTRSQSRITSSSENLWFFSDDRTDDESIAVKRNSVRNDRPSILRDNFNRYFREDSEKQNEKNECRFIVDWQISNPL